jgi:hypothetical protein
MGAVACPYFIPTEILAGAHWPHRPRLPLGEGWAGRCCAPGAACVPSDDAVREFCNLGYALQYERKCSRFPQERDWDAVRVGVIAEEGTQVRVDYSCEREFAPVEHGVLVFDRVTSQWLTAHADVRVQSKADAFMQVWLSKRQKSVGAGT